MKFSSPTFARIRRSVLAVILLGGSGGFVSSTVSQADTPAPIVGTLTVHKQTVGFFAGDPTTFALNFDCHVVVDTTFSVASPAVLDIPASGSCQLNEAVSNLYTTTYDPAQSLNYNGGDLEATIVNTRKRSQLRVAKLFPSGGPLAGEEFLIDWSCSTAGGLLFNGTFTFTGAATQTTAALPAEAVCTVTERTVAEGTPPGYTPTYDPAQTVNLGPATVTVIITNTRRKGSFAIAKTTVGGDGTFSFNWSCVLGAVTSSGTVPITTSNGTASPVVVPDIPTDSVCTVTEVIDADYNTFVTPADGRVTIGATAQTVTFRNERKAVELRVTKFYDANVNGTQDAGEVTIPWRVTIGATSYNIPAVNPISLAPGVYLVTEASAAGWVATTPTSQSVTLPGQSAVSFGNVCIGAGGARSKGYWSNSGKGLITAADLDALRALHLVGANGQAFDPANAAQVASFLKNATATNMANMASAQLAAMQLNVLHGLVSPAANVWDGTLFRTVASVIAAAEAALTADGLTPSGDPNRASQDALKDVLDRSNNNAIFLQPTPCGSPF